MGSMAYYGIFLIMGNAGFISSTVLQKLERLAMLFLGVRQQGTILHCLFYALKPPRVNPRDLPDGLRARV